MTVYLLVLKLSYGGVDVLEAFDSEEAARLSLSTRLNCLGHDSYSVLSVPVKNVVDTEAWRDAVVTKEYRDWEPTNVRTVEWNEEQTKYLLARLASVQSKNDRTVEGKEGS